jgi:hypothetical protein
MTARRTEPEVVERPQVRPVMRNRRTFCPRCAARLQRDYEGLTCIACSYEFTIAPGDREWRDLFEQRKAAALGPLLIGARLSPWLVAVGLAILAVGTLLSRMRQRAPG